MHFYQNKTLNLEDSLASLSKNSATINYVMSDDANPDEKCYTNRYDSILNLSCTSSM